MGRCFLARLRGDAINAVLAAAGTNLRKLLGLLRRGAGRFERYLSELYEVVRGCPEDYGWKRPTRTREMLVETLHERTPLSSRRSSKPTSPCSRNHPGNLYTVLLLMLRAAAVSVGERPWIKFTMIK
jgi:hypothetical protein